MGYFGEVGYAITPELKTFDNYVLQKGTVEAEDQDTAMKKLNVELGISPHVGELLEVIAP